MFKASRFAVGLTEYVAYEQQIGWEQVNCEKDICFLCVSGSPICICKFVSEYSGSVIVKLVGEHLEDKL